MIRAFILAAFAATLPRERRITLPPALEKELAAKAREVTEVTLDGGMLQLARQALSGGGSEQAAALGGKFGIPNIKI